MGTHAKYIPARGVTSGEVEGVASTSGAGKLWTAMGCSLALPGSEGAGVVIAKRRRRLGVVSQPPAVPLSARSSLGSDHNAVVTVGDSAQELHRPHLAP